MIFIEFVELIVVLLFLVVMASQVFIPLARGTRLFPFFMREQKLEADLAAARQKKVEEQIQKEIEKTKGGK